MTHFTGSSTLVDKKHKGVALIQVLLITGILAVLALYLSNTAKDQVRMAQWTSDRATAKVALHSAESELLFALLTEPLKQQSIDSSGFTTNAVNSFSQISSKWNFYGKQFQLNSIVNVSVQDQAGLMDAHYPKPEVLRQFITYHGYTESEATRFLDVLLDWQDIDSIPRLSGAETDEASFNGENRVRNGVIPTLRELELISDFPRKLTDSLLKNMTIYRQRNFNPMNSSIELLSSLTDTNIAQQVIALRNNNQLTKRDFIALTGINEEDGYYFTTSNYVGVSLISRFEDSMVQKSMIIRVSPISSTVSPINIYASRG